MNDSLALNSNRPNPPLEAGASCLPFLDESFRGKIRGILLRWFSCRPLLVVARDGVTLKGQVIGVERIGVSGEDQLGIDLWARNDNGETWVFQCKRH